MHKDEKKEIKKSIKKINLKNKKIVILENQLTIFDVLEKDKKNNYVRYALHL